MKPKVSVIVPVYNSSEYLRVCLESIVNQTIKEIEVILVNDGSTDESPEICDEYARRDQRVRVIHQTNQGVSKARNAGINVAMSEWIMFVDSDDWIELNTIEVIYQYVKNDFDILSFSLTKEHDNSIDYSKEGIVFSGKDYQKYLLGACLLDTGNYNSLFPSNMKKGPKLVYPVVKLYRKRIINDNNISFPESVNLGEDQIFNLNVVKYVRNIFFIDLPLYHYRIHTGSACYNTDGMIDKYKHYINELTKHMVSLNIMYEIEQYINYRICDILKSLIVVSSIDATNLTKFKLRRNQLYLFIKEDRVLQALKDIRLREYKSIKDKVLMMLLKYKLISGGILIYYLHFKMKK